MDWSLNRRPDGKVGYLMVQKGGNVVGTTTLEAALWMVQDGAKKHGGVRMTEAFAGYPLTADGVYYFDGTCSVDGADACEVPEAELGADGLPLLAVAEKPKLKKRVKDVVCE